MSDPFTPETLPRPHTSKYPPKKDSNHMLHPDATKHLSVVPHTIGNLNKVGATGNISRLPALPPNNTDTRYTNIEQWEQNIKEPIKWTAIYYNMKGDAVLYKIDIVTNQIFDYCVIMQQDRSKISKRGRNCIKIIMKDTTEKEIQIFGWIDDGKINKMKPANISAALNSKNLEALPKLIGIWDYNEKTAADTWIKGKTPIFLRDIIVVEQIMCPDSLPAPIQIAGRKRTRHRLRSNRRKSKKVKRRY